MGERDILEGWETISLPPITPKVARNEIDLAFTEGVLSPCADPFEDGYIPPEVSPKWRPKNWIPPEVDEAGNQKCTTFYPCHDKNCQRCEDVVTHRAAKRIAKRMEGRRCFFLTLTERHWKEAVSSQRLGLMDRFKMMRDCQFWRSAVLGGKVFIQFGSESGINCHLHAIVEVVQGVEVEGFAEGVRGEWSVRGGGSSIDVQEVREGYKSRMSVAHYVTKGVLRQFGGVVDELVEKVRKGSYRRPKSVPFGSWRGGKRKAVEVEGVGSVPEQPVEERRVVQSVGKVAVKPTIEKVDPILIIPYANEGFSTGLTDNDPALNGSETLVRVSSEPSETLVRVSYNQDHTPTTIFSVSEAKREVGLTATIDDKMTKFLAKIERIRAKAKEQGFNWIKGRFIPTLERSLQ